MSGSDFYDYVLNIYKRTDKSTEVYEAITDAVMDMKLRFYFQDFQEEGYSTGIDTAGQYKLGVPTDFGHLIGDVTLIELGGGSRVLTKRSKQYIDEHYLTKEETTQTTGKPMDYCIYANQIYVLPVPDSTSYVYQINYSTEEATTMTSETTSVPFTSKYRETLRDLVLSKLWLGTTPDDAKAQKHLDLAEKGIAMIIANEDFNTQSVTNVEFQGI